MRFPASKHFSAALSMTALLAVGVAGCGRRGELEPPPGAAAAPAAAQENVGATSNSTPISNGEAGSSAPKQGSRRRVKQIVPPKQATPLDWLL